MSNNNKKTLLTRVQNLIAGTQKRFSNVQTLLVGNVTYTPAQLVGLLQSLLDTLAAVNVAQAAYKAALKALLDKKATVGPIIKAYISFLYGSFGDAPDPLMDFGLTPRKGHKLKVMEKAQAVEKVLATRTARHTMGSKQKKTVKGSVPTPPATPAPAQPTAANAPAGK